MENMEKWTHAVLQEFRKDCAIFIQQKCKLHKPGRPNINFDAITLNFKNLVSITTFIQLFSSNFFTIKNYFFWLEISEWLGNCRLGFLSNEIRTNVNANSWIKNERNWCMEFFLLILVSSSSISLSRHISSIPYQLKPCFPSSSAIWKIRHSDWHSDHPLATLPGKPEQALRGKLSSLVFI